MASLKKVLFKKDYIRIKLKRTFTHHLELKAKINGVKGRFILDTGASNSCVGFDQIDKFLLEAEDSDVKAASAGVEEMKTQKSENNTIKIGAWSHERLNLILFDLQHVNTALKNHNAKEVNGIIGADILQVGKAIIDYNKLVLYLKKTD